MIDKEIKFNDNVSLCIKTVRDVCKIHLKISTDDIEFFVPIIYFQFLNWSNNSTREDEFITSIALKRFKDSLQFKIKYKTPPRIKFI